MRTKTESAEAGVGVAELQQFTLDFFTHFGAKVTHPTRKKNAPVRVDLPSGLSSYFGRTALELCFHQAQLTPGRDLVTPGSQIFDQIMTFLDQRGAMTLQRLPARHQGGEALMQAARPVNVAIAGLHLHEDDQFVVAFTWRITYRADDKREELYTVLLDERGARLPQGGDADTTASGLDLAELFADAEPPPVAHSAEGEPLPPRLPPMTQLTRLAEQARKYAVFHADLRCVTHEAEILPRLYKALNRLTTYYQQQMEETHDAHDPTGEKRLALEEDLRRKVSEEVENHRLRVDLKLVHYALVQVPVATAAMTLSDGHREIPVQIRLNRYTGALQRPCCHACGEETSAIAIDRDGHITCDACIRQCAACMEIVCAECGVSPCPVCERENCEGCGQSCWACGARACAEHISDCPACGDAVCHSCQATCTNCGVRQCRSHLRADHVAATHAVAEWVCDACAVRCPGCQQYSAHVGVCATSGQRFCEACLATCTRCGERCGPGFYQIIDGWAFCTRCLISCPHCHTLTPTTHACITCGATGCVACSHRCAVCNEPFCADHAQRIEACGHVICGGHIAHCFACETPVCPLCEPACAICERHFCGIDSAQCQQCGQSYCRECVRRVGLCDTCATFHRTGEPVNMAAEPCATDPNVVNLIRHYHWTRTANRRYRIYLGQGSLTAQMVVVVDQQKASPMVVAVRKVAPLDRLLGRLWR
ncbi:MAG: hypothetical protein KJZ93_24740 [Caldilineaceae bacterium]|nr:hypothetical protein [Caldilineaceae bacterium]